MFPELPHLRDLGLYISPRLRPRVRFPCSGRPNARIARDVSPYQYRRLRNGVAVRLVERSGSAVGCCGIRITSLRAPAYALTSGQARSDTGRQASSADVLAISLYKSHSCRLSDGFFTSNK